MIGIFTQTSGPRCGQNLGWLRANVVAQDVVGRQPDVTGGRGPVAHAHGGQRSAVDPDLAAGRGVIQTLLNILCMENRECSIQIYGGV